MEQEEKNPYKGTAYEDLWNANPTYGVTYNPTFWDSIGNFIGFRTKEDEFNENLQRDSNEYKANLAALVHEEMWNSAKEQAEREKQAGLNPDLTGNVGPGEAGNMEEAALRDAPASTDPFQLLGVIGNGLDFALRAYTGINEIDMGRISQGLQMFNETRELAKEGAYLDFTPMVGRKMQGVYQNNLERLWNSGEAQARAKEREYRIAEAETKQYEMRARRQAADDAIYMSAANRKRADRNLKEDTIWDNILGGTDLLQLNKTTKKISEAYTKALSGKYDKEINENWWQNELNSIRKAYVTDLKKTIRETKDPAAKNFLQWCLIGFCMGDTSAIKAATVGKNGTEPLDYYGEKLRKKGEKFGDHLDNKGIHIPRDERYSKGWF